MKGIKRGETKQKTKKIGEKAIYQQRNAEHAYEYSKIQILRKEDMNKEGGKQKRSDTIIQRAN